MENYKEKLIEKYDALLSKENIPGDKSIKRDMVYAIIVKALIEHKILGPKEIFKIYQIEFS